MFIPQSLKDLVPEGVEIRPIPGYEGYFASQTGKLLTYLVPHTSTRAMHPKYARIIPETQGIKLKGQPRLYKTELLALAFPECAYG